MSDTNSSTSAELQNLNLGVKIPYVLLKRLSTEEINYYLPKSSTVEETEYLNGNESNQNKFKTNSAILENVLAKNIYDAYVLLERLKPQDIQRLMNKSNDK